MSWNGFRNYMVVPRSWQTRLGAILGGLCVLAICGAIRYGWGSLSAKAQVAAEPAASLPAPTQQAGEEARPRSGAAAPLRQAIPEVVAMVNGHPISRQELAAECRVHYGKEVLETMVNKHLILSECQRLNISITRREIDFEIEQLAKSFNLPVEQWMKLLWQERGIKPDQYANDIIWPSVALRKLAGNRLEVTQTELNEAFEMEYGPAIRARIIICTTPDKAQKVQSLAAAKPDDFGNLAKEYSEDAPSASVKGLIQPIRKHGPCPEIEQVAFSMSDGQVSQVIPSAGQFVILKRDGLIEARQITLAQVSPRLEKIIRDRKMRTVAGEIFQQLQKHTRVQNVYNDARLSQQLGAGVVALINDAPIYLRQLDEECISRHGGDVLQGLISRRLLELACKQGNVQVSEQEIDAEIASSAVQFAKPLADGSPDVKGWLANVTKRQGLSVDVYRHDAVWPAVALKKLAVGKIEISDEDLKKGFEANYGPRVRCRAIVMNNLRKAQDVWAQARKTPNVDSFGELATKYSIESSSRALKGEVPPIRKYGGQQSLEDEAFALKPGELSGVIQLEDKFVILFCEGYTKPIEVEFASVKKDIVEDIRAKKEGLAMHDYFDRLQETSTIDNFLDPAASRSPARTAAKEAGPAVPASYQAPVR